MHVCWRYPKRKSRSRLRLRDKDGETTGKSESVGSYSYFFYDKLNELKSIQVLPSYTVLLSLKLKWEKDRVEKASLHTYDVVEIANAVPKHELWQLGVVWSYPELRSLKLNFNRLLPSKSKGTRSSMRELLSNPILYQGASGKNPSHCQPKCQATYVG